MNKIRMVIADSDEAYLEKLADYLIFHFGETFQLSYFTQFEYLQDYLAEAFREIDVLLVCENFYEKISEKEQIREILILSEATMNEKYSKRAVVDKFQSGDKIANVVLNHFVNSTVGNHFLAGRASKAKVIGTFSAAGGVGKTSIAVAAANLCSEGGNRIFYLNMETMPSTPLFYECVNPQSLSYLFYYLKEKAPNISMRIEAAKCFDPLQNVYYFCPPEQGFEWDEVKPNEITELINRLKMSGQYDYIFIDLDSTEGSKNIAALESCDKILFVFENGLSSDKTEFFIQEAARQNQFKKLIDKMIFILNKAEGGETLESEHFPIHYRIPFCVPHLIQYQKKYCLQMTGTFASVVKKILEDFNSEGSLNGRKI